MKMIQDYGSFGEWGQDRGGGVLDVISKLLGKSGAVIGQYKKDKSEKAKRDALAEYLKQSEVSKLIKPDFGKDMVSYDIGGMTQKEPFNQRLANKGKYGSAFTTEQEISKTPEQKIGEMSTEDIMQMLALNNVKNKKANDGYDINPISLIGAINAWGGLDKEAMARNKPLFESTGVQLDKLGSQVFGKDWNLSKAGGKSIYLQKLIDDEMNKEEFAATGITQTPEEYIKWLKVKYPEVR